tara:strand:+ start:3535 stop:4368 length:834 start_codon:yes stop_codon:yes gene_type:complete
MDTIIGLGRAGCAIADNFAQHPQYKIFKIDSENIDHEDEGSYLLKRYNHPEEYEKHAPPLKAFFDNTTNDILFIVCGAGFVSGAVLQILKHLSSKNVNILYIKPELQFLAETNLLQEQLVRNVLQEYTRSGLFKRLYIVDNTEIEKILGDVPIMTFFDHINDLLVSTVHMINVYKHNEPIYKTPFESKVGRSISTFGLTDLQNGEEKLFFSLDNVSEKSYYYAINEKELEQDGALFRRLTDNIQQNQKDIKTSFQIYSTSYEKNYGYIVANTSHTSN